MKIPTDRQVDAQKALDLTGNITEDFYLILLKELPFIEEDTDYRA